VTLDLNVQRAIDTVRALDEHATAPLVLDALAAHVGLAQARLALAHAINDRRLRLDEDGRLHEVTS
jgi:hypothetical protein